MITGTIISIITKMGKKYDIIIIIIIISDIILVAQTE